MQIHTAHVVSLTVRYIEHPLLEGLLDVTSSQLKLSPQPGGKRETQEGPESYRTHKAPP